MNLPRPLTQTFGLLKNTAQEWSDDNASSWAAALSYYTLFSIAPLLIIAVGVAGLLFGDQAAQGQIQGQLQGLVGSAGAQVIESMVASARKPSSGILATALGTVVLAFGASGVFVQLQQTMNVIWKVKAPEHPPKLGGLWSFLRHRFLSFAMVLGIGFLLLVSLVLSAALAAAGSYMSARVPGWGVLWHVVNNAVSLGVVTILFAMMFKLLPDADVRWGDVWIGAAVTSFFFTVGKFGIGLYLGKSSVASSYGAAGSLAIVLLWVYYASQVLFFGAEFTQVYSKTKKRQAQRAARLPQGKGRAAGGEVPPSTWLPT